MFKWFQTNIDWIHISQELDWAFPFSVPLFFLEQFKRPVVLNSSRRFTSSAVWRLLKEAKGRDIFSVPFSWKNCLATFFVLPFVWSRIEFALILMVLSERYINESGSSTFDSTHCKGELMFLRRRLLQNNSPKRWLKHMEMVLTLLRSCLWFF